MHLPSKVPNGTEPEHGGDFTLFLVTYLVLVLLLLLLLLLLPLSLSLPRPPLVQPPLPSTLSTLCGAKILTLFHGNLAWILELVDVSNGFLHDAVSSAARLLERGRFF